MAATQCLDAISACAEGKIDADVLNNGISYFLGPLLNWTLVGIIKAILKEIQLTRSVSPPQMLSRPVISQISGLNRAYLYRFQSPHHLNVLRTLLLSSTCPRLVICLCSHSILRLLSDQNLQRYKPASPEHIAEIRARIYQVTGLPVPCMFSTLHSYQLLFFCPALISHTLIGFEQPPRMPWPPPAPGPTPLVTL